MTEETTSASGIYQRLMAADGAVDASDRHVLASVIAAALAEAERPLTEALGLDRPDTAFPEAYSIDGLVARDATAGNDAIEEEDFRALLLDGRRHRHDIEEWLARIIVRRSLCRGHLWHSLGLRKRRELSNMLHRHFPTVAERNTRGMKWKKFFYREMCQAEGVHVCKSPVCDVCTDFDDCFGTED